jgi:hypothetical protein
MEIWLVLGVIASALGGYMLKGYLERRKIKGWLGDEAQAYLSGRMEVRPNPGFGYYYEPTYESSLAMPPRRSGEPEKVRTGTELLVFRQSIYGLFQAYCRVILGRSSVLDPDFRLKEGEGFLFFQPMMHQDFVQRLQAFRDLLRSFAEELALYDARAQEEDKKGLFPGEGQLWKADPALCILEFYLEDLQRAREAWDLWWSSRSRSKESEAEGACLFWYILREEERWESLESLHKARSFFRSLFLQRHLLLLSKKEKLYLWNRLAYWPREDQLRLARTIIPLIDTQDYTNLMYSYLMEDEGLRSAVLRAMEGQKGEDVLRFLQRFQRIPQVSAFIDRQWDLVTGSLDILEPEESGGGLRGVTAAAEEEDGN